MADKARLEPDSDERLAHAESEPRVEAAASGTTRISDRASKPPAADYNMRIVAPLVSFLIEQRGENQLEALARKAGLDVQQLRRGAGWMSWEQFETFVQGVRALTADEAEYSRACGYHIVESHGAFRYIAWAITPLFMFRGAENASKTLSSVGEFRVLPRGRHRVHVTYTSQRGESRLICLSRQAALSHVPAFFGLPPAHIQESKCIGRGEGACEYDISWQAQGAWRTAALTAILTSALFFLAERLGLPSGLAVIGLAPAFGAVVGALLEIRKSERVNAHSNEEVVGALRQLTADEADARREILALGERQRDWDRAIEEAHSARLGAMQKVLKRADEMQQQRETTLLGFSHDLRNPLMVLASTVDFLRESGDVLGDEAPQLIEDVESSITQMKRMLGDFVAAATSQQSIVQLSPKRLDVPTLTASLTRRLRALVQGKPIVPSVIQTREAPATVHLDPLVFDRVTDNLLTNAAKYTERGSIVIEVTGTPGFVVIKISDSGRGISESDLGRIFQPGGSNREARARDSFGVGLSVILQLLEQVGGSLEVMSTVGRGTTFWANFPIGIADSHNPGARTEFDSEKNSDGRALSGRVRIRKPTA